MKPSVDHRSGNGGPGFYARRLAARHGRSRRQRRRALSLAAGHRLRICAFEEGDAPDLDRPDDPVDAA